MIDRERAGKRCRTVCFVRTVEGDLPRGEHGTVQHVVESLGRLLVLVRWEKGFIVPVFPNEIEIFEENVEEAV